MFVAVWPMENGKFNPMQILKGGVLAVCLSAGAMAQSPSPGPTEGAAAAPAGGGVFDTELAAGIGAYGTGYSFSGGRWGDLFAAPMLEGRARWSFLAGDAQLMLFIPTASGGAGFEARTTVRVGVAFERFSLLVGPSMNFGAVADPVAQWVPSVRAQASFGHWGLSAGLFDHNALALAHLTAELGDYGVGFVAPLGLTAHARFWVTPRVAIRVQALASSLLNLSQAWLTVGVAFRPNGAGASR